MLLVCAASERLTARGHVAPFPAHVLVLGVAPQSDPAGIRVAAVVLGGRGAAVREHVVAGVVVLVRRLDRPRLAVASARRHRQAPDVLVPGRRQRTVSHACGQRAYVRGSEL